MRIAISSLDDPRVNVYRNLKDKELDRAGKLFIAEGEYIVRRLLESDFPIVSLLLTEKREHLASLVPEEVPVYVAPREVMHGVLGMHFQSGVMACGQRKPSEPLERVVPKGTNQLTLVICPDVNNAENIGSMIRIAAAFGADAILLGERCHDPFWRQSVRVSMGTVFKLPIYRAENLLNDLRRLRVEWGVELIATVLDSDAEPLASAARRPRIGLLFGNEKQGLDADHVRACDRRVTVPMKLGTDSLNVAISAGIFLYHFTRENLLAGGPHPLSDKG